MTQNATVPSDRPIGLVPKDVTAVVHNADADHSLYVTQHGHPPVEIKPQSQANVSGPASAIGVGGSVSVVVDENAVGQETSIAEANPERLAAPQPSTEVHKKLSKVLAENATLVEALAASRSRLRQAESDTESERDRADKAEQGLADAKADTPKKPAAKKPAEKSPTKTGQKPAPKKRSR